MKALALLFLSLLLATKAFGDSSIKIGEYTLILAYNENNKDGSLREFILSAENLENWTVLVGVRNFLKLSSPKKYIESMASEYKRKFPLNKFAVFEKKETSE